MTTQTSTGLRHQTVLLDEAVDALIWRDDGIYIDGTFGRGGHSRRISRPRKKAFMTALASFAGGIH